MAATSDSESPRTLFYKAEIFRYFQCDTLKGVGAEAKEMLENFEQIDKISSIDDYYYLYLMQKNLREYGQADSTTFLPNLKQILTLQLYKFDIHSLSIPKYDHNGDRLPEEGLTLEGLKLIEMLAALVNIETQQQEISAKLQNVLFLFQD